ncbi:MAG: protoheme IX farnesyltransferase, partial [Candidatus Sumerlaeia bacterium]|nr:protoheme IX farnesyltransferase [Candidatus Sumerlaeia bacterium]
MVRSHAVDAAPPVAAVALGLPARVSLYLEMSKPRLSLLAVASAVVGYLLAGGEPGVPMLALGVGSFLMSAGSSLLNQVLEREHDARMVRTRGRALPSGRISPEEALGVGILTGLTGAVLLAQLVHPLTAALGVAVLTGYVLLYTPLKRRTSLNTFVGAVVGALPVAMGTVAAAGKAEEVGAALFAIQFLW